MKKPMEQLTVLVNGYLVKLVDIVEVLDKHGIGVLPKSVIEKLENSSK